MSYHCDHYCRCCLRAVFSSFGRIQFSSLLAAFFVSDSVFSNTIACATFMEGIMYIFNEIKVISFD